MFRRLRIVFLALILGVLLLGPNAVPSISAQADDFPIGLYIAYAVWVDHMIPPGPAYGYNITLNFTRWIDQDNFLIEYKKSIDDVENTLIGSFSQIYMNISGHLPLWVNVSTWETNDIVGIGAYEYEITGIEYSPWNNGFYERFHIWNATLGNYTSAYYHSTLGLLTDYGVLLEIPDNGNTIMILYDYYLLDTNFDDYYPLLDYIPSTTTTQTSTGTTNTGTTGPISSTSPGTTESTTSPTSPLDITTLDVVFGAGIVVEIVIIALFLKRE